MINITVPRLYASDFPSGETRLGDSQIIGRDVIDGGCDKGAVRTIAFLKARNIRDPWLHITHSHYDHRDCADKILSDPWFSPRGLYCQDPNTLTAYNSSIRSDINALKMIIQKAKDKNIPVFYLGNDQQIKHGDLEFTVYRAYPKYTGDSDEYLNEGSLCYWFPKLRYLTTGDASLWCAYKYNLDPLIIKCGHHGNDASAGDWLKPSQMTVWLVKHGCRFYWDNDFSTHLTDFLMTGREDAINAGMIILNVHSDITMNFALGKVTIMNNGKTYTDSVPYDGKAEEGWVHNHKGWWYRLSDGSYAKGWRKCLWSKEKVKGSWFLFGQDGYMLTGWQKVNGKWYYLDPDTGVMRTGWIFVNGIWYYLEDSGAMHTGWLDWKGRKCYLNPANGHCLVNCTRVIDGKTYRFDKGGYATEIDPAGDITTVSGKLNDISASRRKFVIDIANYVRKYAPQYGICVYSPIIAQAIHESGWGESKLAAKYHNYFGLKCGTAWKGKSVNMKTQEEYSAGTMTTISANFRVYDNMEQGVKGYFEFIQLPRYSNLKGVTSPRKYLENIISDGYATGKQYVDHVMNLINLYNLPQFDVPVSQPAAKPTEDPVDVLIRIMEAEVGTHEGPNNKTKYGDEMHALQPSNMDKNAAWCDAFFDWCILKLCEYFGYGADMARMVLCGDFDDYTYNSVALYKKAGRWSNTPHRGDQIFFGGSGHTGIVTSVNGGTVHTIEGNKGDEVRRGSYSVNSPSIIGYGRPRYDLITGQMTAEDMPLIKRGSKGSAVLQLQKMLNAKGYKLTEDGDFGSKTEAAVKAYQKANGLEVDGEVGPMTWGVLFK